MIASLRRATFAARAARVSRDLLLQQALLDGSGRAAGRLDLLEQLPRRLRDLSCQRLDAAGAGGRIGDAIEIGLFQQDELHVARDAAREAVGQADRQSEGQGGDASAPPTPAAVTAMVVRSMFT